MEVTVSGMWISVRLRQAQKAVQIELPRCGGQEVAAAHHLGDARFPVVHHHRQLIDEDPVRPAQDKVPAAGFQIFLVRAVDPVRHADRQVRRFQPPGGRALHFPPLFLRAQPAGSRMDGVAVCGVGGADKIQAAPGAPAGKHIGSPLQLFQRFFIGFGAKALGQGLPVPLQAQPAQVPADALCEFLRAAQGVQVFHPQDDLPARASGGEPGQEIGKGVAQVHAPAGRGRETSDGGAHFLRPAFSYQQLKR